MIFTLFVLASGHAQGSYRQGPRNPEKALFRKSGKSGGKSVIREPRAAKSAKRKQEKKEKTRKKEYEQYVKASRERSYEIQSPEVKARMKQNEKDTALKNKLKKKKAREKTRKAAKKYD